MKTVFIICVSILVSLTCFAAEPSMSKEASSFSGVTIAIFPI